MTNQNVKQIVVDRTEKPKPKMRIVLADPASKKHYGYETVFLRFNRMNVSDECANFMLYQPKGFAQHIGFYDIAEVVMCESIMEKIKINVYETVKNPFSLPNTETHQLVDEQFFHNRYEPTVWFADPEAKKQKQEQGFEFVFVQRQKQDTENLHTHIQLFHIQQKFGFQDTIMGNDIVETYVCDELEFFIGKAKLNVLAELPAIGYKQKTIVASEFEPIPVTEYTLILPDAINKKELEKKGVKFALVKLDNGSQSITLKPFYFPYEGYEGFPETLGQMQVLDVPLSEKILSFLDKRVLAFSDEKGNSIVRNDIRLKK